MNDVKEKAKAFLDKTKERLKTVSKKVWIAIAAVLVVLIVAAAVALTLNKQDYAVLVTQVSDAEASNILNFLSEQGVANYKVEDGNTVLVPAGQESALKARILMANLNQTGNYYTENLGSFSTNEERLYAEKTSLELRMAGVIRNFPNVVDATVNITPGENRAYILDSNNVVQASAAVMLTMMEGQMLTDEQAAAIQQFVSHSVQGLEIDSVSISDTTGNVYLTEDALNGEISALKMQLQQGMENRIRTQIMNVLTPFFGEDNVRVGVTCEVEVDRTTEVRNETILPEWAQDGSTDGRGVIGVERHEALIGRPGDNPVGGLVGTETALDLAENGHSVTLVEMLPKIMKDVAVTDFLAYSERIAKTDMRILTETRLEEVLDNGARVSAKKGEETIEADTVILALGLKAEQGLYNELAAAGKEVYLVGDAVKAGEIFDAIHTAYRVGLRI